MEIQFYFYFLFNGSLIVAHVFCNKFKNEFDSLTFTLLMKSRLVINVYVDYVLQPEYR